MNETILETAEPVIVQYRTGLVPLKVKLFTFDHEDDPNIPEGRHTFILTCSRRVYPELRQYFAQAFTAFVARINLGRNGGGYGRWNDLLCNPCNDSFREILSGNLGDETELFIIPLQKHSTKKFAPVGGVNFVVGNYRNRSRGTNGKLNLISSDTRVRYDGLILDKYGTEESHEN